MTQLDLDLSKVRHLDLVQRRIKPKAEPRSLSDRELRLLARRGFALLRDVYPSFGTALYDIFRNDQPLFVTTDALLHALHKSFGEILPELEAGYLAPLLIEVLDATRRGAADVREEFASDPVVAEAAGDVALLADEMWRDRIRGPGGEPQPVPPPTWLNRILAE